MNQFSKKIQNLNREFLDGTQNQDYDTSFYLMLKNGNIVCIFNGYSYYYEKCYFIKYPKILFEKIINFLNSSLISGILLFREIKRIMNLAQNSQKKIDELDYDIIIEICLI